MYGHRHHRTIRSIPACATAAGLVRAALAVVANARPAAAGQRVVVSPGESIQAAIDAAKPNSTIVVSGGVHAEQVTISTNGITLIGDHTQLVPPATPMSNPCSGVAGPTPGDGPTTQAGICVVRGVVGENRDGCGSVSGEILPPLARTATAGVGEGCR